MGHPWGTNPQWGDDSGGGVSQSATKKLGKVGEVTSTLFSTRRYIRCEFPLSISLIRSSTSLLLSAHKSPTP